MYIFLFDLLGFYFYEFVVIIYWRPIEESIGRSSRLYRVVRYGLGLNVFAFYSFHSLSPLLYIDYYCRLNITTSLFTLLLQLLNININKKIIIKYSRSSVRFVFSSCCLFICFCVEVIINVILLVGQVQCFLIRFDVNSIPIGIEFRFSFSNMEVNLNFTWTINHMDTKICYLIV